MTNMLLTGGELWDSVDLGLLHVGGFVGSLVCLVCVS